jgi:hypothetical protein
MSEFIKKFNRIAKIALLVFSIVLLNDITCNSEISRPNTSRDGKQTWIRRYGVEDPIVVGLGIWGDEEYIYTCGGLQEMSDTTKLMVIKWDKSGDIIWEYFLDTEKLTYGTDIWGDEQFLYICGKSSTDSTLYSCIVKLDKDGNEIWYKEWGSQPRIMGGIFLQITGDDSGIYLCGDTDFTERIEAIMKFDKDGSLLWNTTWSFNISSYVPYSELVVDDSNLYMCGTSNPFIFGSENQVYLIKWDKLGSMIWNRTCYSNNAYSVEINGLELDEDFIYFSGNLKDYSNFPTGFLGKLDKEATILWNKTIEIKNYTNVGGIACNQKEVFVCGTTLSGDSGLYGSFFLSRWNKDGVLTSLILGSNTIFYDQSEQLDLWVDEKDLYACGTTYGGYYGETYLILAKWDVSINYFARYAIPGLAIGLTIVVSWIVFKPIYKVRKRRVNSVLKRIEEDIKTGLDYDRSYSELEDILNDVDRYKDSDMEEKWHELHNISEVNRDFENDLANLKKQFHEGDLNSAHSGLMYLLKKSHESKYVGILDKRTESEITTMLKQVTQKIKKSNQE